MFCSFFLLFVFFVVCCVFVCGVCVCFVFVFLVFVVFVVFCYVCFSLSVCLSLSIERDRARETEIERYPNGGINNVREPSDTLVISNRCKDMRLTQILRICIRFEGSQSIRRCISFDGFAIRNW